MAENSSDWAQVVARDWPALEVVERAGWRLGSSYGVTKRANSAVALTPDADPDEPERFYRGMGMPSNIQVWPGHETLDDRLAARGYRKVEPSLVLVRDLVKRPGSCDAVAVEEAPRAEWDEARRGLGGNGAYETAITGRIMAKAGMVYAMHADGVARGCATLGKGLMGVYGMVTRPDARRRGHTFQVLDALLAWGYDNGARRAYLLVVVENTGARALYENAGFAEKSRYHYRVLD